MSKEARFGYRFEPFWVSTKKRLLARDGMPVPLEARTFKTLLRLLDSAPRIVEKEEFMKDVWHDAEVEDSNLTVQISLLRKALGDSPKNSKYIKTVARQGA